MRVPLLFLLFFVSRATCESNYWVPAFLNGTDEYKHFRLEELTENVERDVYLFKIRPPFDHLLGNALLLTIKCEENCDVNFELYELVMENGTEHKIPRHIKDQRRFVSAINSGFLVVMRPSGRNRDKFHVHFTYSANEPYSDHLHGFYYSCPPPLVYLEKQTDIFRPSIDHLTFNCGVKIIASSNVLRLWVQEKQPQFYFSGFIMSWNANEYAIPNIIPLQFEMIFRLSENVTEGIIFDTSVAIIFEKSREIDVSEILPDFIGLAPQCECAESLKVIHLNEIPYRPVLYRPTFQHHAYDQSELIYNQFASCYHVFCSSTILLSAENDECIHMTLFKKDDNRISPFLSFTDGNTTIDNIRTAVKSYTFSSKSATVTFNAIDKFFINKYGYDLHLRDVFVINIVKVKSVCECPSPPEKSSNSLMEYQWDFEVDSECEHIDCHFHPPRISNYFVYDNYGNCANDFLIVRHPGNGYKEAKIGRNEIHIPHNDTLMYWFHRNGRCENSTKATVSMKHSSCECPLQEIYRDTSSAFEIYSPGYNDKFSYCPEMNCTIIFNAPDDLHFLFFIHEMDIADDSIDIHFGSSTSDEKKTLTGRGKDIEVGTQSSHAIFNFLSDDDVQGRGYYVKVTTVFVEKERGGWWKIIILLIILVVIVVVFTQRRKILSKFAIENQRNDDNIPLTDSGSGLFA